LNFEINNLLFKQKKLIFNFFSSNKILIFLVYLDRFYCIFCSNENQIWENKRNEDNVLSEAQDVGAFKGNGFYDEKQFHSSKVEYHKKQNQFKDLLQINESLKAKIEMENSRNDFFENTHNKATIKSTYQ
jgi:hypothetical protein